MISPEEYNRQLIALNRQHDALNTALSVSEAKDNIIKLQELEKKLYFLEKRIIETIEEIQTTPNESDMLLSRLFKSKNRQLETIKRQQRLEESLELYKLELTFANSIRSVTGQVTIPKLKAFIAQENEKSSQETIPANYQSYIKSAKWREKAEEAKAQAGNRCQVCNRSRAEVQLDAHHRTYVRLGNELPEDITVLCRDCHQLYEDAKKVTLAPIAELKTNGFCMRCKQSIKLNPQSPYCYSCFKVWKRFENADYQEKYCHVCGKENPSTRLKPACYTCYKEHRDKLEFPQSRSA